MISNCYRPTAYASRAWRKVVPILGQIVCAMSVCFAAGSASAAGTTADARAQYESERARCNAMTSSDERANCLQSAGAAYDQAKQGKLDVAQHPYLQNKFDRCTPLPPAEKDDCIRRMQGQGTVSGSVEGGGDIRETDTVHVTPAPSVNPGSANTGGTDNR